MTWALEVSSEDQAHEIALGLFLTNSMFVLAISMMTILEWYIFDTYIILLLFGLYVLLISFINTYEKPGSIGLLKKSNIDILDSKIEDLNSIDKLDTDHYIYFQIKLLVLNIILFITVLVSQINQFGILGIYPILLFTGQIIHFLISTNEFEGEQTVKNIAYSMISTGIILGFQPWFNIGYFTWIITNVLLGIGLALLYSSLISIQKINDQQ